MGQLVSVRSNQDFGVNYKSGQLVPQTEIIILVEKPSYKIKGEKITRDTQVSELRFKTGPEGLNVLIGQLQAAQKNITHFDQLAAQINSLIESAKPIEGSTDNL